MPKKKENSDTKIKGLTDRQLAEKYGTGKQVDFDRALKCMAKSPSPTTLSKAKK